jgi:hypothetical protein
MKRYDVVFSKRAPRKIEDQVNTISVMHGGTYIAFVPFATVHARSA